ncbi:MAG TPA: asparagine synthase (glutamine-hydrolyzing) [Candidatus Krumholzibacteria bacterium]|nr:asparagine synthase (glutamine-hydrolyzing) [Candidatus Krumholzibacteria bacterium]
MCGIAGIYAFAEAHPPLEPVLEAMVGCIHHRGPDERKWIARGHAGLGIARLSIIDPEGSHQPLYNESRDVVLVFNGEIYNYLELRATLEQSGHHFATKGDGEVIVHGYEQWGTGVFEKLRGMYAIAIWDERTRQLVLARDRMGIKPLYLCRTPDAFLFASEVKAMLASGKISAELRPELVDCYLTLRYVPAPDTIFRGITKLGVGEFAVVKDGAIAVERYYTPAFGPKLDIDEAEAAERLRALLDRSMDYHLQSDVPLGVFLSGGLDSGFLTAMASAKTSTPLNTFSVGFDRGGIYDETDAAGVVAKKFGTRQHALKMSAADYLEMLPEAVYYMDEPMADPSAVPMMAISRIAREHVKVVLSGEGSDELFGGYPRYQGEMMAGSALLPPQSLARSLARALPLSRSRARGIEGIAIRDVAHRHLFWETVIPERTRHALLADGARNGAGHALDTIRRVEAEALATGDIDAADRLYFLDLRTWLVEDLLLKKDKMGMSASIEARVPFLDQDVVSFALRLPAALKVRGLKGKRVFRRVISAYLPEEILNRPKVGFAVPLNDWFRHEMADTIRGVLLERDAFSAPYLRRAGIEAMLEDHQRGRDRSLELLTLIMFELWGRIHVRGEERADMLARYRKSA